MLLRRSALLVLDEASSGLPTEQALLASVAKMKTEQTLHNFPKNELSRIDRFILLENGQSVASGTHSALYKQFMLYRTLFNFSEC